MTDAATEAQIDAADPHRSTWLSANAGSGKTRVLTNRVARLLLRGTDPRNILCLTYTKAAASEMQNRLFKTLGGWAMLDDGKLHRALTELGEVPPNDLSEARTLFARAIEAPGGLRIQTIHALCASILRQFPLEGGVSPQFRELDEAGQIELIDDILNDLADRQRDALEPVSAFYSDEDLTSLGRSVAGKADDFLHSRTKSEVFGEFSIPGDLTIEKIVESTFAPGDLSMMKQIAAALHTGGSTNDLKAAKRLDDLPTEPSLGALLLLEAVLLNASGQNAHKAKIGKFPTKKGQNLPNVAPLMQQLEALMERVESARHDRVHLEAAEKTLAVHQFAQAFLPAYHDAKLQRGVLDFDDLIRRTRDMLTGSALSWVLYRLDGRIEHILVDEAQDTSPAQWQIIRALTDAMADDPDRTRTLFVVGDKKQSIYSFQGADAEGFETKEREFDDQLLGRLRSRELLHSFRSSPAILSLVDTVAEGLRGMGNKVLHHAYYPDRPGRVDLLPLIPTPDNIKEPAWHHPVDRPVDNAPSVKLGENIAEIIGSLLETETIQGKKGEIRPVRAGDIMILVQRRSAVFDQIIQACKARNLPIAGSDRLRIGAELAVRDLLALLSFLDLPEDDLSLAAALRSPLFGLSEAQLFDLASNRPANTRLWPELRRRREDFSETVDILDALRRQVDFRRPYELLEHILNTLGGRTRLLARLGAEAEDGIDELLNQAIAFERENVPSLTGFLTKARSEDIEVKRDPDASDDLIRAMTVHGAKGLERPIVILPDTTGTGQPRAGGILTTDTGLPVLSLSKEASPDIVQEAKDKKRQAEQDERNRLLYVAMTRAESWLIVAGVEPGRKLANVLNWHETIESAMIRAGARTGGLDPDGLRLEHGQWPDKADVERDGEESVPETLPAFLGEAAPRSASAASPIAPSKLGGAKVLGGGALDEELAMKRGRQLHLLLEHLPGQSDPEGAAQRLLSFGPDRADPSEIPELINQAMRNLTMHPALFDAATFAEVDVTAHLADLGRPMVGRIDRLVVSPDKVLAVDFKTNSVVPVAPDQTPEGLLRQMGAYLDALEQIYNGRKVEVAILWTETCDLMVLPHAIVRNALRDTTIS